MSSTLIFTALIATLIATAYLYVRNAFSYWKRKGVPYIQPSFPFGNLKDSLLQRISFAEAVKKLYDSSKEPYLGIYSTVSPFLIIRDPNIIRDILIKDFPSFHHRGINANEKVKLKFKAF